MRLARCLRFRRTLIEFADRIWSPVTATASLPGARYALGHRSTADVVYFSYRSRRLPLVAAADMRRNLEGHHTFRVRHVTGISIIDYFGGECREYDKGAILLSLAA